MSHRQVPVGHEDDCPRCQQGDHGACLDNPEEGLPCPCAEGGHL